MQKPMHQKNHLIYKQDDKLYLSIIEENNVDQIERIEKRKTHQKKYFE